MRHGRSVFLAVVTGLLALCSDAAAVTASQERPSHEVRIARLPRVDGNIPTGRCSVHGVEMEVAQVPIRYGMPALYLAERSRAGRRNRKAADAYLQAKAHLFPETRRWVWGGCVVREDSPTDAEVYACRRCRDLEDQYVASHPDLQSDALVP